MQDVRPRIRGPVDPKRLLVRGRRAHHAQAAVVVDVLCAERDSRELPGKVGDLGGEEDPLYTANASRPYARWMRRTSETTRSRATSQDTGRSGSPPISHERRDQTVGVRTCW